MPLTAVGKVFKPALRWDAAQRAVTRLLADVPIGGQRLTVQVGAHPEHGSLIRVEIAGASEIERVALQQQIDQRLDPLVMKHRIVWG